MPYDFPPSSHMKKLEPFETNTHFYVQGTCTYREKEYNCDFEVAYRQRGEIRIIVYLSVLDHISIFNVPISRDEGPSFINSSTPHNVPVNMSFSGTSLRDGIQVSIPNAVSISSGFDLVHSPQHFVADTYEVHVRSDHVEAHEKDHIQFDLLNVIDNEFPAGFFTEFPILLEDDKKITLRSDISGNITMSIPLDAFPAGYKQEEVAQIICAAFSLATGRDIQAISKITSTDEGYSIVYYARPSVIQETTYAIVAEIPQFWRSARVASLVSCMFKTMGTQQLSADSIIYIANIVWYSVRHRIISNRAEDQARLIVTSVEELLHVWEKGSGKRKGSTYKERLENLFKNVNNSTEWAKTNADQRISSFVTIRNNITHEGSFPEFEEMTVFEQYLQVVMMMPLLFFAIIGYDGPYNDLEQRYRDEHKRRTSFFGNEP